MNDIKRGEMFYISRGGASYNGSEQHADRPAVVVSNNKNNENSNVVEVVYMTTQPKTDLPTHVTIRSTGRISTVLCEQVYSVSTERIGTYIGEATDKEMENIDIALMISLQLDNGIKTAKEYYKTIKEQQEEIDSLKREIETTVYLRKNIEQVTREVEGSDGKMQTVTEWQYDEKEMTVKEYENMALMKSVVKENTSGIVESVTQFQKDAVIDEYTQQLIEEGLI